MKPRLRWVLAGLACLLPNVLPAQTRLTPPPNRGSGSITLLTPGPRPDNLYLTGSPAYTTVNWSVPLPMRGTIYSVQRWLESDLTCCNAQVNGLTTTRWTDDGVQWSGTYVYRITAFYPDGSVGAVDARYVRPDPVNPANFHATQTPGLVTLRWDPVPNVSWYALTGPNIPFGTFQQVPPQTYFLVRNLPSGTHTWSIGSVYASPKVAVSTPTGQFPVVTVIVPE